MVAKDAGEGLKHMISGEVAVPIVDAFEMVDIEHQHGRRSPIQAAARINPPGGCHEGAAVGNARQSVGRGCVATNQFLLHFGFDTLRDLPFGFLAPA
jgi:hypothetical protein